MAVPGPFEEPFVRVLATPIQLISGIGAWFQKHQQVHSRVRMLNGLWSRFLMRNTLVMVHRTLFVLLFPIVVNVTCYKVL